MKDFLLWNKISRIIMLLAERLDISPVRALDIFYHSEVCQMLHDPSYGLHIMSDAYIVDDIIMEIQSKGYE